VINRGNYRTAIFQSEGARAAFETCLAEACEKSNWLVHAWCLMSNHYHLALETPEGNLVAGMQWMQATFANRFNRYRGENGHLFQGRYKALLVEEGNPLGQLCHYIHLNPVRAGLVSVEQLREHRSSSYWHLCQSDRPRYLQVATALRAAGELADTEEGREAYARYLAWLATESPEAKKKTFDSMSRGWALGSADFKQGLLQEFNLAEESRAWDSSGVREIREARWAAALAASLRVLGRTEGEAREARNSAPWKVAVAGHLKQSSQAGNGWLAVRLHMGKPGALSQYVGQMQRGFNPEAARLLAELTQAESRRAGRNPD
jgi:REP element-mobilizing transposase RayT